MGTEVHIVLVEAPPALIDHAPRRFADLEDRWSRFRPQSEVSQVNHGAGSLVSVSPETAELFARALEGWRLTGGLYDPTVLGAVLRAGYDRPISELRRLRVAPGGYSALGLGCGRIEVGPDWVRLPPHVGFDPGGIAKGLAADLVCRELIELGTAGALVNAGGDVRVLGRSAEGACWTIAVVHPFQTAPLALLGLANGGVATSTTLLRRWQVGAQARHHLIDPTTGEPATGPVQLASVVAGEAWLAEVYTKALILAPHPTVALLNDAGLSGLIVDETGRISANPGLQAYLGSRSLPRSLSGGSSPVELGSR